MTNKIINLGILAHVDAGKTTLTESFLYLSGVIKSLGSVDKGTAFTDFLDVEKERGISVRSALSTFFWNNVQINLIDTPGHIDFSADLERSIRVLDVAILVVSAVEGIQAHTENIWYALRENKIPTIIFINKLDRIGADSEKVICEIKKEFNSDFVTVQTCKVAENVEAYELVDLLNNDGISNSIIEVLANHNDQILEEYINGSKIELNQVLDFFKDSIKNNVTPILLGVAKSLVGVKELLDFITEYSLVDSYDLNKPFSGLIYQIYNDDKLGQIAGVKVVNGSVSNKEIIKNKTQNIDHKINQIKKIKGGIYEDSGIVNAGDIAAVSGLTGAKIGDILGTGENIPDQVNINAPLLTVQVEAEKESDYANLANALHILALEDPTLEFEWLKEEKELHLKIMGWIQIQVLERIIENRFNIKAKFKDPTVIYKETPSIVAEGYARYWMPKPCWAIIKLLIEKGEEGSGVFYKSNLSVDKVQRKYQNEIEQTISTSLKQGPKGWEVTDLIITLIDGEDHEVHTRPGDFKIATPMAIMNGLVNAKTSFLEPFVSFMITAPENLLGNVTSDIIQMRGQFESPEIMDGKFTLKGIFPIATSMDYAIKLSSRSGGKAKIKTKFHSYKECPAEFAVEREYKGISPLDEAKYILKARKALE